MWSFSKLVTAFSTYSRQWTTKLQDLDNPQLLAIIFVFHKVWRFIKWLWAMTIVGLIVPMAVIILTTVYKDLTTKEITFAAIVHVAARTVAENAGWSIFALVFALIITLVARWADACYKHDQLRRGLQGRYVLKGVSRLTPNQYVFRYVQDAFFERVDPSTNQALSTLAIQTLASTAQDKAQHQGICVFGKPNQGKTRLAWEAMRRALSDWLLVRWQGDMTDDALFEYTKGKRVVLWLDDLHEYEADFQLVQVLVRRLAEVCDALAIVATCRDGIDEINVRAKLSKLIEQLTCIYLDDISVDDAESLAAMLRQSSQLVSIYQNDFDGTPGSLLLGISAMRDQRYWKLSEDSRRLLRAMKLLRSALIYQFSETRVRYTAQEVMGLTGDMHDARDECIREGFLTLGDANIQGERALFPVADVYLEKAIADYPVKGASVMDQWTDLRTTLKEHDDYKGLVNLGVAYSQRSDGDRGSNLEQAYTCLKDALAGFEQDPNASYNRIVTQNNIAIVLIAQSKMKQGVVRTRLLDEAVNILKQVLPLIPKEVEPEAWIALNNTLGMAFVEKANSLSGRNMEEALHVAVQAFREVANYGEPTLEAPIELHKPAEALQLRSWIDAQTNLAAVLTQLAEQMPSGKQITAVDEGISILEKVDRYSAISAVAQGVEKGRLNLALALLVKANMVQHEEAIELTRRAVDVTRALPRQSSSSDKDYSVMSVQCKAILSLVQLAEEMADYERDALLNEAKVLCEQLDSSRMHDIDPLRWASAQQNIGHYWMLQSSRQSGTERVVSLEKACKAFEEALSVFTPTDAPIYNRVVTTNLRGAQRLLDQAREVE